MVRCVCGPCNNGWMSDLEQEVRVILTRIAGRKRWRFSLADLEALRRWLVKTGLMMENFDTECRVAGQPVYDAVMNHKYPPGEWYFGLASVTDDNDFEAYIAPWGLQLQNHVTGERVAHTYHAMQYLISIAGLLFLVRYSIYPVRPPARLDHELIRHPRGRPIGLEDRDAGRQIRPSRLPVMLPASIEDLKTWGHPTRIEEAMTLLAEGDDRWIGRWSTAKEEQIVAAWPEMRTHNGDADSESL